MGAADLACNSFGQTYNCTMVQMAAALSSVINGGSYYEPHVVKQILNDQGAVVKKVEPNLVRETVSQATSDFVRNAMFLTVDSEEGTGKAGRVAGYKIGGKTGTAQKLPRSANNYLLSFAGFAPADRSPGPDLCGHRHAQSAGKGTGPQYLCHRGVPEDHDRSPSLYEYFPGIRMWPGPEDESLAAQGEGITNQNQGGLEPGGEAGDGETQAEETEPMTDENGETIPETEPAGEEVVPYDDGLGLPDTVAGGGQTPGGGGL